jgi:hypothetical protein
MRLMSRPSARLTGLLGIVLAAGAALAGPPALDRVPENAGMVIAVPSLARFHAATKMLSDTLQFPADEEGPLKELTQVLGLDGLNKEGSAAMAVLPGADGKFDFEAEPNAVIIVPVTDYAKFVTGLHGTPTGVTAITPPGEDGAEGGGGFAKDLGGGYAAVSETKEALEGFKGEGGHAGANDRLLGGIGKAVADNADILFIANLQALAPNLREGADEMHQNMEAAAANAPQEMGGAILMMDTITNGLIRDGQAGVIALAAKESGFHVDFAAQFKEGSPAAAYFDAKGSATSLLSKIPNTPYFFAVGLDTTAPGVKQFFKQAAELSLKAQGDKAVPSMMGSMLKTIDTMGGVAFEWGAVDSPMGGLLTNALAYIKTSDPAAYTTSMQETFAEINGKTVQGFQYQTAYKPGAKDVDGTKVDEWSMRMNADPNDPNAQYVQMVTQALFGAQGGPGGYIAPAEGGVAVTYSNNSTAMGQALKAAKGGEGLGADPGVKMVSGMLPADRTVEAYIGIKSILDTVGNMGVMPINVPADLPPIGISGTLNHGGVRFAWFVPTRVVETLRSLGGGGEDMNEGDDMGGGN